ncbi:MAG: septal ring lytic transglycosylase RlpA family protein [Candidatus Hydrogenedentes bacterium]|nr:septal ring lytic transglycosylase RlpA family protein [Candidatus Hydrogenedentota bacterium]
MPWAHKNVEKGNACWYGEEYRGKLTASGEPFDPNAFSAAHRKLPFDTIVLVKNLRNDRSTKVRINDRGPFVGGRIIDLSKAAARDFDMIREGVVPVRLEVIRMGRRN